MLQLFKLTNRTFSENSKSIVSYYVIFFSILLYISVTGSAIAANGDKLTPKLKKFGDYTVHFNAFSSDSLQPKIAKVYGITRSKNRGILSISILKKSSKLLGEPIKAKVVAQANNLTGQMKKIDVREIDDGDSIYYVSEFRVAHKEILNFTVEVTPEGTQKPMVIKFRQQFYTN